MKTLTPSLAAHIEGEVTSLATCWKITRRDGEVLGFTDHDMPLEIAGVLYAADSGITASAVETQAGLSIDNLDMEGMLSADAISEEDVLAGRYDYAAISVFRVNYADLSQGSLRLRDGWLGEVELRNGQFIAEMRGLSQPLAQRVGEHYAPACRAKLGDTRCGINMAEYTVTGTIDSVEGRAVLIDTARTESAGYFSQGTITITSGENAGICMEVKEHAKNGRFLLAMPLPAIVTAGDAYSLQAGCDKLLRTCAVRFENAANFRGEPHLPGLDKILETAATRNP